MLQKGIKSNLEKTVNNGIAPRIVMIANMMNDLRCDIFLNCSINLNILVGKEIFLFDLVKIVSKINIERIKELRPRAIIVIAFFVEASKRAWFDVLRASNWRLCGKRIVPTTKGNKTPATATFLRRNRGFRLNIKIESIKGTIIKNDI
jgi:hypothetical protein